MSDFELAFIQHRDHRDWMSQLKFYQDEIGVFQNELGEILFNHVDLFSVLEHFEEYKSIFHRKLERISEIRKQIILHERLLARGKQDYIEGLWDHEETRDQFDKFVSDFEELKKNFRGFVSHQIH